jgi:hypothetical protein
MPQANITYDAPYNRSMVKFIEELDRKHWEKAYPAYHPNPMGFRLGTFHGEPVSEVKVGGGSSPEKWLRSGNSPAYPPHNMNSGMAVHSGGARYSGVDGAVGAGGFNPFDLGYDFGHDVLGPAIFGRGRRPRKPRAKKGGDWISDIKSIGHAVGEPFSAVPEMVLKSALGLGRKPRAKKGAGPIADIAGMLGLGSKPRAKKGGFNFLKAIKDVGHAVGEPVGQLTKAVLQKEAMGALGLGRKKAPASRTRSARADIVKQVMREKGMKMIEASKYVKAHGLY